MFGNSTEQQLLALMKGNDVQLALFQQYQKELSFFFRGMIHDIKNPLTLINSSIQLIEKNQPSLSESPYWSSIKTDLKDVFSLLEQLRCYQSQDELNLVHTDLSQMLIDLSGSFEAYAREKQARIQLTLADNCHPYVDRYLCDKVKLKEALTNLLKNAIEAAPENSVVSILCSVLDSRLSISINNTGPSILPECLENLFLPFYTTKQCGTGLGLPTAQKIIAAHKGQLHVSSDDDKTTFTISLPIEK